MIAVFFFSHVPFKVPVNIETRLNQVQSTQTNQRKLETKPFSWWHTREEGQLVMGCKTDSMFTQNCWNLLHDFQV